MNGDISRQIIELANTLAPDGGRYLWAETESLINSLRTQLRMGIMDAINEPEIDMGEIHLRVMRSRADDIEWGLATTAKYPQDREFLRWREIFLAQKDTLLHFAEYRVEPDEQKPKADRWRKRQDERVKILEGLASLATDEGEKERLACKLATLRNKELDYKLVEKLLRAVQELKGTTTSQEMTTLADYAIAHQDCYLAEKLVDAQPFIRAKDGDKSTWTQESKHLTPYNRRGHLLGILANRGLDGVEEKLIEEEFAASLKLGCLNECRSMARGLMQIADACVIGLGVRLADELGYKL